MRIKGVRRGAKIKPFQIRLVYDYRGMHYAYDAKPIVNHIERMLRHDDRFPIGDLMYKIDEAARCGITISFERVE